ncbi:MAG: hypothetical protein F6J87_14480 [Spirulina sp. SIO3F2]|nr:hypothetical protein [Spirulina sp. SIO3F2]
MLQKYAGFFVSLPLCITIGSRIVEQPNAAIAQTLESLPQNQASDCNPELVECAHRGLTRFAWSAQPIPHLISPRRTKILNPQPLIRWLPIAGASDYTVILEGEGLSWQAQTATTQLRYTGGMPLKPSGVYEVIIEADTGASSEDEPIHPGGIAFEVLTSAEQEVIATQVEKLAGDTRAIADLYLANRLVAEGIAQLEQLWQTAPSASLALRLGNLYFEQLFLPTIAEEYYQQALEQELSLAQQAIALVKRGQVRAVMHDSAGAIDFWQQAQVIYSRLGNVNQVEALARWIEEEQEFL